MFMYKFVDQYRSLANTVNNNLPWSYSAAINISMPMYCLITMTTIPVYKTYSLFNITPNCTAQVFSRQALQSQKESFQGKYANEQITLRNNFITLRLYSTRRSIQILSQERR